MKTAVAFSVAVTLAVSTLVKAQSSCFIYPRDGTEIDVGEGPFLNPEFCNKECECVRTFPDFESGIPLDQTICGCSHQDKTTSELYCLVIGERGLIPELGVCECKQEELPTLNCEPYRPTNSPVAPPSEESPSVSPASAGELPEPMPVDVDVFPSPSSEAALSRGNFVWLSLIVSSCIIYLAAHAS